MFNLILVRIMGRVIFRHSLIIVIVILHILANTVKLVSLSFPSSSLLHVLFTADCGLPEEAVHPLLLTYNSTLTGSIAVYSCTSGYALIGNDTFSVCDDEGEWSDIDAECIGKFLNI